MSLVADAADRRVVVVGARSSVGHFLLPRLSAAGYEVHALSRRVMPPDLAAQPGAANCTWHQIDVTQDLPRWATRATRLIHLAPLWLLPAALPSFAGHGVRRVIAFSSTSRFTKADSPSTKERALAARLAEAEEAVARGGDDLGIAWTIFRPTMIYGAGVDKNVSFIAAFIRRFGFFPIPGAGQGLRQPVHADDLAIACVAALGIAVPQRHTYDLGGGEELSYREMVERIFVASGRRPRLLFVPAPFVRAALRLTSLVPRLRHLDPAMADRAGLDLVCDSKPAVQDLGYQPRPFL